MNEAIIELANTIGVAANAIVDHYVVWHVVSAITWPLLWISVFFAARSKAFKRAIPSDDEDVIRITHFWLVSMFGLFAVLSVGFAVADLVAPKAIAIHQLLKDIRG